MTATVLIVDDEPQMLEIVSFALETQGFDTLAASTAEQGWKKLNEQPVSLVVLDVMLPGRSGLTLCRMIREQSDVPVLLLTARGESSDKVAGFEAGADDYVVKPFNPRELALRAKAIIRRSSPEESTTIVLTGPLTIDLNTGRVTLDRMKVALSETETKLMVSLARHVGEPVSWQELVTHVWGTEWVLGGKEMLKTTIYRLRSRLGRDAGDLVQAVRGRGYVLEKAPSLVTEL